MNRFSNIQTSSFTPLSLEEIMTVPLAKQRQHDALQLGADEYSALQSKYLSQDSDVVNAELDRLKKSSDEISEGLLSSGVSRDLVGKFRSLKRDKENQFSQNGIIGAAQGNYDSATKFINDLATKKEQQAGWSPQQAKAWAQKQVSEFAGTQNDDGTFASFQGQGLAQKVDENEFIRTAIDDIEDKVTPVAFQAVKVGGLPAFNKAFQEGTITEKDYNTIMSHLNNMSRTDVDLMGSLRQQAAFTGEKDWDDFGSFSEEIVTDENGKAHKVRKWNVGKSRYGQKMASLGGVSDYRNIDVNTKIITDKVGYKLWEMGLEESRALKLVEYQRGELNNIDLPTLKNLRSDLDLVNDENDILLSDLNNKRKELAGEYMHNLAGTVNKKTGKLYTKEDIEDMADVKLKDNLEYQILSKEYRDSAIKLSNAQYALNSVYKESEALLSPSDKKGNEMWKYMENNIPKFNSGEKLDRITAIEKAIMKLPGGVDLVGPGGTFNQVAVGEEIAEKYLISKYLELSGFEVENNANTSLFGIGHKTYDSNLVDQVYSGREAAEGKIKTFLGSTPKALSFYELGAGNIGGLKMPIIEQYNKILTENFRPNNAQLANGETMTVEKKVEQALGESYEPYIYDKVSVTDEGGFDQYGNKFNNVHVQHPTTGKWTTIQVISDDANQSTYREVIGSLANGNPRQQKTAAQMEANFNYIKGIKASGMSGGYQDQGEISMPLSTTDGKPLKVKWKKTGKYFTAEINGHPLNGGNIIEGENHMALVLDKFAKSRPKK